MEASSRQCLLLLEMCSALLGSPWLLVWLSVGGLGAIFWWVIKYVLWCFHDCVFLIIGFLWTGCPDCGLYSQCIWWRVEWDWRLSPCYLLCGLDGDYRYYFSRCGAHQGGSEDQEDGLIRSIRLRLGRIRYLTGTLIMVRSDRLSCYIDIVHRSNGIEDRILNLPKLRIVFLTWFHNEWWTS